MDAGHDPDLRFADPGNAARKIWLDHRIRITFDGLSALHARVALPGAVPVTAPYHAMGRIHYAAADGVPAEDGLLLYLKPSLHGREPVDVLAYAASSPTFPHEGTSDQWFSESQFESYRALGFEEMNRVLNAAQGNAPGGFGSLRQMLEALC
jgi:hypothetical protein